MKGGQVKYHNELSTRTYDVGGDDSVGLALIEFSKTVDLACSS